MRKADETIIKKSEAAATLFLEQFAITIIYSLQKTKENNKKIKNNKLEWLGFIIMTCRHDEIWFLNKCISSN